MTIGSDQLDAWGKTLARLVRRLTCGCRNGVGVFRYLDGQLGPKQCVNCGRKRRDWGGCNSPDHDREFGPCTDLGQCRCGMPVAALRPDGETYGFHADDCASPERHYGPCEPGGTGHPVGVVRGYWPGMEADIERQRARHNTED